MKSFKQFVKDNELDAEEEEILRAIESGEYKPIPITPEERGMLQQAATRTLERLKKEKSITLRMNNEVLSKLKKIAQKEGMPYQTLIGSILHKYTSNYKDA